MYTNEVIINSIAMYEAERPYILAGSTGDRTEESCSNICQAVKLL
jgi:hypothetical protein